jgi:hypothetical protein
MYAAWDTHVGPPDSYYLPVRSVNTKNATMLWRGASSAAVRLLALLPAPPSSRHPPCVMLRNVDRCEALLIIGGALVTEPSSSNLRSGVTELIELATEEGTHVCHLGEAGMVPKMPAGLVNHDSLPSPVPAAAAALTHLRTSLLLTPDAFGGSDGFGSSSAVQVDREPSAPYVVCIVTNFDDCDAALRAGMRCVALPAIEGGYVDEELEGVADVCLDELDGLTLDDFTTPGSFWLNPSLPRDAHGVAVDPETGLRYDGEPGDDLAADSSRRTAATGTDDEMEDLMEDLEGSEAARILSDLDSLL